jgi:hypothetical protein
MTDNKQASVEEIARRAYGLYLERGSDHGHDVADWVKAEKELSDKPIVEQAKTKVAWAN